MNREEIRWVPKKPECDKTQRGFHTVGLTEIRPALMLLLFGYAIAVAIAVVEIVHRFLSTMCLKWKVNKNHGNKNEKLFIRAPVSQKLFIRTRK